jgi:hypothetical protein
MEDASSTTYSRQDYPLIKYWYKVSLKTEKKGTSDVGSGARGGTRLANGENVMHFYIENVDGTPVDGSVVTAMREDARSIWESFSRRDIAPRKWGKATMEVRDEYVRVMETKWPMLRYCENHWKVHAIATINYPAWYRGCVRREIGLKDDDEGCDEPVAKKCKTTMEEASDSESSPPPEVQGDIVATHVDDVPAPPRLEDSTTRPGARPLRNPL